MPNKPFQRGDLIGHPFRDPALLKQALTHRSAGAPHNERLEFLGDSIVNMMAAEALYQRWPKADEGAMTRARAELVREGALAVIGRTLELGDRLILGPGEMKSGGHRRDSILADAVEAVVAAIYLDAGFEACRAVDCPGSALRSRHCRPPAGPRRTPRPACRNGCRPDRRRCRSMNWCQNPVTTTPSTSGYAAT